MTAPRPTPPDQLAVYVAQYPTLEMAARAADYLAEQWQTRIAANTATGHGAWCLFDLALDVGATIEPRADYIAQPSRARAGDQ